MRARTFLYLWALALGFGLGLLVPVLLLTLPIPGVHAMHTDQTPASLLFMGVVGAGFGVVAALAAQFTAFTAWPVLDQYAHGTRRGWPLGLAMAALTHIVFAPLAALAIWLVDDVSLHGNSWRYITWSGTWQAIAFLGFASLLYVGWVSFPACAVVAQIVVNRRRRELAHGE